MSASPSKANGRSSKLASVIFTALVTLGILYLLSAWSKRGAARTLEDYRKNAEEQAAVQQRLRQQSAEVAAPRAEARKDLSSYTLAGLKIDLPAKPSKRNPPVNDEGMETELYQIRLPTVRIDIARTRPNLTSGEIDDAALDSIVTESIQGLRASGASELSHTISTQKVDGCLGRSVEVTCRSQGQSLALRMMVFGRGSQGWIVQVVGAGPDAGQSIKQVAEAIFGSIRLINESN